MHNNSTRISAAERATYSHYGTQTMRLSKDSQHQFDQCGICLHILVDPMACPKGHMYCKACIFENLLEQKKSNKKKLLLWQEANKAVLARQELEKQLEAQKKAEAFEKLETSLTMRSTSAAHEQSEEQRSTQSWWLPNAAPSGDSTSLPPKPPQYTTCPRGSHQIKLKDLVNVEFKHEKERKRVKDDEDIPERPLESDWICYMCMKDLKSVSKVIMMRACGHAMCYKCSHEFAKKSCPVCGKKCDESGDHITLQSQASSFAEGGATIAKKEAPAPRMM